MPNNISMLPAREPGEPKKTPGHHLPAQLTPLIGRQQEVAIVCRLLLSPQVRLLTLTGPGGVGKTRLALAAAHNLMPDFTDGVCFVPLSAISEPDFVLPAIAQALGLREAGSHSLLDKLQMVLADQSFLLLLDNFEQVLAAAPLLADLAAACPHLTILVTSRAALQLHDEHEFPVSPLALPDLKHLPASEALMQYAACTLFVERTQAIKLDFQLTEANARTIAEICMRLDGLPLALELAAARLRLLSPQALLSRLSHRLEVLTGGTRDAPARQQTMRSTIAWSYQLLAPREQQLFRWLSVFVGGCELSAVEAIAKAADLAADAVLDGVSVLLDNHLLHRVEQPEGELRLLMLETIREYGLECLESCGELEAAQAAHAQYFLAFAEEAEPHLRGKEQVRWAAALERERENLRAALNFLLEQARIQTGQLERERRTEQALRLCIALSWFWYVYGYGREGLRFLEQALTDRTGIRVELQARALYEAAHLAFVYRPNMQLERLAEESLALYRELNDSMGIAISLFLQGTIARSRSQFALARSCLEEAVVRFEALGNRWRYGQCLTELARVATEQGRYEQAYALLTKSLLLYQALGEQQRIGWVYYLQARLLFATYQDLPLAQQLVEQSLTQFRGQGNTIYDSLQLGLLGLLHLEQGELEVARNLLEDSMTNGKQVDMDSIEQAISLARLSALQGDTVAARRLYQESLALLFEYNNFKELIAVGLEGLAVLEAGQGNPRQAVRLWGAAQRQREAIGAPMYPIQRPGYEQALALAQQELGEQAFAVAWAEGCSLTPQQVLASPAPASAPTPIPPRAVGSEVSTRPVPSPYGLTARELEILRLLVQGWTDAQIAEQLVISPRTVNRHTTSLYSKLGVSSRAAATHFAIEHHLL